MSKTTTIPPDDERTPDDDLHRSLDELHKLLDNVEARSKATEQRVADAKEEWNSYVEERRRAAERARIRAEALEKETTLNVNITTFKLVASAIALSGLGYFAILSFQSPLRPSKLAQLEKAQQDLTKNFASIEQSQKEVYSQLSSLDALLQRASGSQVSAAVTAQRISAMSDRLKLLEEAMSTDTTRAVSLPLMKKDIEMLQERYKNDIAQLHDETARMYTFAQWAIILIPAFLTLMLGLNQYFNRPKKPATTEATED